MAEFDGDHQLTPPTASSTPSFSQLLFGDDEEDDGVVTGIDYGQSFNNFTSSVFPHTKTPPKMLCFGGKQNDVEDHEMVLFSSAATTTPQRSVVTCSDSSSASSGNTTTAAAAAKSHKKRNGGPELAQKTGAAGNTAPMTTQRNSSKKTKPLNSISAPPPKARTKERLGERITTLQQLVSPFGKTDTASVLHEAMGYIRFLHDQVQVLCSPYLQHLRPEGGETGGEELRMDLRSRGLCLVPVGCTVHVASANGADYWSPAMGNHVINQ